ncbi:unnamed protein product [Effrenium voratum]|uniref:Uncharacterized protein n=1 Tax=Effrenium voratum TaxID=2562239 RepID=A0AA36I5S4_9DINO|nr:unnamed protein product [Effrenium voratum]
MAARFVGEWQNLQRLGRQRAARLGADEVEDLEAKQRKRAVSRAKAQLSQALHEKHTEEAVEAAELLLDCEEPIAPDVLRALLRTCAENPDAERFARVVSACVRGGICFDEQSFASLIGQLLANEAAHALVRCALNFGLEKDGDVIPLIPYDIREAEQQDVFKGATNDDTGELDLDLAEAETPTMLEFSGCMRKPELNGLFQRVAPRRDLLGHSRLIYEKRIGISKRFCCYYWEGSLTSNKDAASWESGWYIGTEIGGGGQTLARRLGPPGPEPALPPAEQWELSVHQHNFVREMCGFKAPTSRVKRMQALNLTEEDSEKALEGLELEELRGRVVGREPAVCKYFCHFFILLALELMAEVQGFRSRWGYRKIKDLVSFGIAFDNMKVESQGRQQESKKAALPGWPNFGTEEVIFNLPHNLTEERCRFKSGEQVVISYNDPMKNRVCEGMVRDLDFRGHSLVVNVSGRMPEDPWQRKRFRIDQYANRTTYERQVAALMQFISMERTEVCEMLVAAGVGKLDEAVIEEAKLMRFRAKRRKLGKGYKGEAQEKLAKMDKETLKATKANALENWDSEDFFIEEDAKAEAEREEKEAEEVDPALEAAKLKAAEEEEERKQQTIALAAADIKVAQPEDLELARKQAMALERTSETQKQAIVSAMSKRLTIVQGPPGTGKTHTSVRILTSWVRTMGYRPLLATSECNVAVDNIAEGLVANGIKVVRIGHTQKVSAKLEQAILRNLVAEGRQLQKLEGDEDYEEMPQEPGEEPSWKSEEWKEWRRRKDAMLRRRVWDRKQESMMRAKILEDADVICATTIASGGGQMANFNFHGILIDEVAQATETSCIVPIVCRGAKQLVLCGDHCQLPPSVISRESELRGFSLSLYSRLTGAGVPYCFLDTQYRAHPMLMEFSAGCIYHGKLKNGVQASDRPRPNGLPWPSLDCPAMFMESSVEEHLEGESKANMAEALVVKDLVQGLLDRKEVPLTEIGVVTPYKGQVRVLRKLLQSKDALALGAGLADEEIFKLEIASVDNFQGREKEVIIFSAVRCNTWGSVGFLKDWRRLNVMITRARRALVVVGNAATLCKDEHWRKWLECTERQGGAKKGTVRRAVEEAELGLELTSVDAHMAAFGDPGSKNGEGSKNEEGSKNGQVSKNGQGSNGESDEKWKPKGEGRPEKRKWEARSWDDWSGWKEKSDWGKDWHKDAGDRNSWWQDSWGKKVRCAGQGQHSEMA